MIDFIETMGRLWQLVEVPTLSQLLEYSLWGGMFLATVIFIRMFFTRWGDRNVTAKAIVVSTILHWLAGVSTTYVRHAPVAINSRPKDVIRNVRIIDPKTAAEKETPSERGSKPVWEKLPAPLVKEVEREKRPDKPVEPPDPERQRADQQLTEVKPQETKTVDDKPQPPSANQTAMLEPSPKHMLTSTPNIGEETAEARPDVAVPRSLSRAPQATTTGNITDIRRTPRSVAPKNSMVDARVSAEPRVAKSSEPAVAALPDSPDGIRQPRVTAATPEIGGVQSPPGVPSKTTEAGGRAKTAGPFSRSTRPGPETPATQGAATRTRMRNPMGDATSPGTEVTLAPAAGFPGNSNPDARPVDNPGLGTRSTGVPSKYRLRAAPNRRDIAKAAGASDASEKSVELALKWFAAHQSPEGFWDADGYDAQCPKGDKCPGVAALGRDNDTLNLESPERDLRVQSGLDADSGLTGLVLLCFLGSGFTQDEGLYADQVDRALRWLIRTQRADGYLGGKANRYARMYCHGMATIALGEAYGMTRDPSLREPLARAVGYVLSMQNPDGGWRYDRPQTSDMSVVGWQIMALKSAQTAGLDVPPEAFADAAKFLKNSGRGQYGGLAGYGSVLKDTRIKPSMTAEAMFCRQLFGETRAAPASAEAAAYLGNHLPRFNELDLYYWYYGTLAMYQHGGEEWAQWNGSLRDVLVREQRKSGHAQGSWDPYPPWGDFGGRLFSTAMSTLCLEAYYRFLPNSAPTSGK